jgi:hypothetical protein
MKYISYTLFGTAPKYYVGAERNVEINKKLLPDWQTLIFYHKDRVIEDKLQTLIDLGVKLVDVSGLNFSEKNVIHFPYFWRFFAFLEDSTSIVRDLDSRVSEREVSYINRWLESNLPYFIIRDHPWHSPVPSGLFGINGKIKEFEVHFESFVNTSDLRWGTDQEILHTYMENIDKSNIYYCGYDKSENYIPRDNPNFFIGMQIDENDKPLKPSAEVALSFLKELNL